MGKVVFVTGIYGSGKSTQIKLLSAYLIDNGYRVGRIWFSDTSPLTIFLLWLSEKIYYDKTKLILNFNMIRYRFELWKIIEIIWMLLGCIRIYLLSYVYDFLLVEGNPLDCLVNNEVYFSKKYRFISRIPIILITPMFFNSKYIHIYLDVNPYIALHRRLLRGGKYDKHLKGKNTLKFIHYSRGRLRLYKCLSTIIHMSLVVDASLEVKRIFKKIITYIQKTSALQSIALE